jgi:hypothetical protein
VRRAAAFPIAGLAFVFAVSSALECGRKEPVRPGDAGDEPGVYPSDSGSEQLADADGGGELEAEAGPDFDACVAKASDWPGWVRYSPLHDPCARVDVPADASVIPPLIWVPCATGRSNCLEMPTPWPSGGAGRGWFSRVQVGKDSQQQPQQLALTVLYGSDGAAVFIYDFTTSAALTAWRSGVSLPTDTLANVTVAATVAELQLRPSVGQPTYANGSLASLLAGKNLAAVPTSVIPVSEVPQYDDISETTYAFGVEPEGTLNRVATGTNNYVVGRVPKLNFTLPMVRTDDVFGYVFTGSDGWPQYYRLEADGGVSQFLAVHQHVMSGLAADGQYVYWIDSYGNTTMLANQPYNNLWYAPYSDDPSVVAASAKQLAALDGPASSALAFGGYWAAWMGQTEVTVVRASDGAVARLAPEPGRLFSSIGYVDDHEVWVIEDVALDSGARGTLGVALERIGFSFGTDQ